MTNRILNFIFTGQDRLSPVADKAGKNTSASGHMIGTAMAGAAVAISAALVPALMNSVDAANHANKVADQTAAVLKSTGNQAHVTSASIGELSAAIMNKTGIDDEAIRTGANMLLTFTNVRNEAGRGNNVFDQTTQAVTDMAAAMNGGSVTEENMRAMSVKVGKALNDPIKGLSALGKVGVSFTAGQKEQIKAMVASGNQMGAQKIILGELRKEFGGSAAAAATPFKKLKTTMGELSETIGGVVLPIAIRLTNWAQSAVARFSALPKPVQTFLVILGGVVAIGTPLIIMMAKVTQAVKIFGIVSKIAALGNPWFLLAAAIAVIAILIITHWKTIARVASQVWGHVLNVVRGVWNWIKQNWPLLLGIITGPIGLAVVMVVRHWNKIRDTAAAAFNAVVGFFRSLPGRIVSAIGNVGRLLVGIGGNLISGLFSGITGALRAIGSWVRRNIFDPIVKAVKSAFGISSPSTVMAMLGGHLMSGFIKGILSSNAGDYLLSIFGSLPKALGALFSKGLLNIAKLPMKALRALGGLGSKIGGFFKGLFGGGAPGAGVQKWAALVMQVLGMLGQSPAFLPLVLRRMNQESGGNQFAVNNWDSNAMAGTPSMGLMQTIPGTFAAYAGPFRGLGIFNPLANIYAGLNYAIHRYGSLQALGRPGGYAKGTMNAKRGWAWVGEKGRELMLFGGGEKVIPDNGGSTNPRGIGGGRTIIYQISVTAGPLARPADSGREVVNAIREYERGAGNGWRS